MHKYNHVQLSVVMSPPTVCVCYCKKRSSFYCHHKYLMPYFSDSFEQWQVYKFTTWRRQLPVSHHHVRILHQRIEEVSGLDQWESSMSQRNNTAVHPNTCKHTQQQCNEIQQTYNKYELLLSENTALIVCVYSVGRCLIPAVLLHHNDCTEQGFLCVATVCRYIYLTKYTQDCVFYFTDLQWSIKTGYIHCGPLRGNGGMMADIQVRPVETYAITKRTIKPEKREDSFNKQNKLKTV